ncbi:MAG: hypothetical protein ACYDHT_01600 [Solirubrobacteraceae bacterium]
MAFGSPPAAFSQIDSSLLLVACGKVGRAFTPCLHRVTAAATVGDLAAGVVAVELELVDPPVVALLELLLPPELPQPASRAPVASSTNAAGESLLIIGSPFAVDGCRRVASALARHGDLGR